MAKRYELNDRQWALVADILPGKKGDPGRTANDNRLFVNGVLWVLRSGAQWDELPERYGKWKSVAHRVGTLGHGRCFALSLGAFRQLPRVATGGLGGLRVIRRDLARFVSELSILAVDLNQIVIDMRCWTSQQRKLESGAMIKQERIPRPFPLSSPAAVSWLEADVE
jgi:putative transposase